MSKPVIQIDIRGPNRSGKSTVGRIILDALTAAGLDDIVINDLEGALPKVDTSRSVEAIKTAGGVTIHLMDTNLKADAELTATENINFVKYEIEDGWLTTNDPIDLKDLIGATPGYNTPTHIKNVRLTALLLEVANRRNQTTANLEFTITKGTGSYKAVPQMAHSEQHCELFGSDSPASSRIGGWEGVIPENMSVFYNFDGLFNTESGILSSICTVTQNVVGMNDTYFVKVLGYRISADVSE